MATTTSPIVIDYFTDVLCVWAYAAQKRSDEIQKHFGDQVIFKQHFISIFGAVEHKMTASWGAQGASAYHPHVLSAAAHFDYLAVHPDIWLKNRPASSLSVHVFLKAVQLLAQSGAISDAVFNDVIWRCRLAFFRDLVNIAQWQAQRTLAEACALDVDFIQAKIHSGEAHAALELDRQKAESYQVNGSPSYVFNEGRQKLYGNVGYRIIEVNLRELLTDVAPHEASWC